MPKIFSSLLSLLPVTIVIAAVSTIVVVVAVTPSKPQKRVISSMPNELEPPMIKTVEAD